MLQRISHAYLDRDGRGRAPDVWPPAGRAGAAGRAARCAHAGARHRDLDRRARSRGPGARAGGAAGRHGRAARGAGDEPSRSAGDPPRAGEHPRQCAARARSRPLAERRRGANVAAEHTGRRHLPRRARAERPQTGSGESGRASLRCAARIRVRARPARRHGTGGGSAPAYRRTVHGRGDRQRVLAAGRRTSAPSATPAASGRSKAPTSSCTRSSIASRAATTCTST